jgi:Family of unknown function (DUF6582)
MATTRQKAAARRNIKKARGAPSRRARGQPIPKRSSGLTTRQKKPVPRTVFAFPKERKEPLNDAQHVRNAVARFDQVEGVTDMGRDAAWRRIRAAARRFGVHIEARGWRSLMRGGKSGRTRSGSRAR